MEGRMKMSCISIVIEVIELYAFVRTHRTIHSKG